MDGAYKRLNALIEIGADMIIDSTLNKLIALQIAKYQQGIKEITAELAKFEEKYGMSSEDFYRRFESGELGDEGDFVEWAGFCENTLLYKNRLKTLETALKE